MERRSVRVLDTVALLEDVPEHRLVQGQVGTIVEALAAGVYEVEFCDNQGRTYALLPLRAEQMLPLIHEPVAAS